MSPLHQALVELLRSSPGLVANLISDHIDLPAWTEASYQGGELTDPVAVERRADEILLLYANAETRRRNQPLLAIALEIQLNTDPEKQWTWIYYPAATTTKYRCPTVLLIICPNRRTARWAQKLVIGRQSQINPWVVLGPDQISTDPQHLAAQPELAVLTTITHGRTDPTPYTQALNDALITIDTTNPRLARLYTDLVAAALPRAAARILEETMTTTTLPSWSQRLDARGRAESLLAVLQARQLPITPAQTQKILTCTDIHQLDTWIRQAITTSTTDELLN